MIYQSLREGCSLVLHIWFCLCFSYSIISLFFMCFEALLFSVHTFRTVTFILYLYWSLYHYEMTLFSPFNILSSKISYVLNYDSHFSVVFTNVTMVFSPIPLIFIHYCLYTESGFLSCSCIWILLFYTI